jgi:hypothetical protein
MQNKGTVRDADIIDLRAGQFEQRQGTRHRLVRGQNFLVEWIEADAGSSAFPIASRYEMMVLLPDVSATIEGGGQTVTANARSVAIIPAGTFTVHLNGSGTCCVLASISGETPARDILNAATYQPGDPRVAPIGPAYERRLGHESIRIFDIDRIEAPKDNPRLKMLQSATMSINWVEYQGPRDRAALSPHSHKDFEQGSLALAGDFEHHLRVEWGKNADLWRDDVHAAVGSPSIMVIPPEVIHTSAGVHQGHHLLIDIFSPPRRDFIAKNWVANASEYAARVPQSASSS